MTRDDPRENPEVPFVEASPTLLKRLVKFAKEAGAVKESDTKRNGFLSYHAETHAAGMGIAAGFWYGAEGNVEFLSLVYAAAVHGRAHASNGKRTRILRDIKQEPHYAVGGVVFGAVLGVLVSWAVDLSGLDPFEVLQQVPLWLGVVLFA